MLDFLKRCNWLELHRFRIQQQYPSDTSPLLFLQILHLYYNLQYLLTKTHINDIIWLKKYGYNWRKNDIYYTRNNKKNIDSFNLPIVVGDNVGTIDVYFDNKKIKSGYLTVNKDIKSSK